MTTMAAAPARRPFYADAWRWLLLGLIATLIGFWPSFFSRPTSNAMPHTVHGIISTLWLVLLVAQAGLVRALRMPQHRTLGKLSYVLMPLMVLSGAWVLHLMLAGETRLPPPVASMLGFVDFGTLIFLLLAYGFAIRHRHDVQVHARWMVTTMLVVLPPALTRLAFVVNSEAPLPVAIGFAFVTPAFVAAVLAVQDWRSGRLRAAYPAAFIYLLGTYLSLGAVGEWSLWQSIAAVIAGR